MRMSYNCATVFGNQKPENAADLISTDEGRALVMGVATAMGADPQAVMAALAAAQALTTKSEGEERFWSLELPRGHRVVAVRITCHTGNPTHYEAAVYDEGCPCVQLYVVLKRERIGGPGRDVRATIEIWGVSEEDFQNLVANGVVTPAGKRLEVCNAGEAVGLVEWGNPAAIAANL